MHKREKESEKDGLLKKMRDKVNSHVEIDTEEMIKWRSLSQEEIDQCWKNLGDKWRLRLLHRWSGGGCAKARNTE